ncbi:SDR family oxidoreductase [Myxococcota bacterium]|nr:SDR family oxidoreductase [Myxococcota bacterium]
MLLVIGATGNVGRPTAETLLRRGATVRVTARAPERLVDLARAGADLARLDFTDPTSFAPALDGVKGLLLVRPPELSRVEEGLFPLLDAARAAGVEHVALLSVPAAERYAFLPHARLEARLRELGLARTLLRAGFFSQNLLGLYRPGLDAGALTAPTGDGAVAWVDTRDLGEAAAAALMEPTGDERAWTLTGPEALSFAEVAARLSVALGRKIQHSPQSLPRWVAALRAQGTPWEQVAIFTALQLVIRLGGEALVDPTLAQVLGRPARRVEAIADTLPS